MKTAKETWETAKGALQVQVSKANFDTWLKDTVGISHQGNQFVIGTPSAFAKEWLEKRLHSLVTKVLISLVGHEVEVQFQVCPDQDSVWQGQNHSQSKLPPPVGNPRHTFENFVVGGSNRLAYAAALGISEEPGRQYNPLFIHGGSGLGKTHLSHAIGNEASENGFKVVYTGSEQFTNEFISSIRERRTEEFRSKFRNADILVIEDIQFLVGKPQTQETLFHTFNELHDTNRQLVITSDRPPKAMTTLESSLCSRLECGLIAQVEAPDLETRLAILHARAEEQQVVIDEAVFDFIAQRCQRNVRELEGALTALIADAKMAQQRPTLELAQEALRDMPSDNLGPYATTPASILKAVADHFQISLESLKGRKRDNRLAMARQIAIYLVREKTNCPLQDIGKLLGGRDHSTILRGYHRIAGVVSTDPAVQRNLHQIVANLPM